MAKNTATKKGGIKTESQTKTAQVRARLQKAKDGGRKGVDLSGMELTGLPPEVFDLAEMESLNLSGNALRSLPGRLWEMPKLERVLASGNPIESLPHQTRVSVRIDGPIYRRCRAQLDGCRIELWLRPDEVEENTDFWLAEMTSKAPFKYLSLGDMTVHVGTTHPNPNRAMSAIYGKLGELKNLESLSLAGYALGTLPEGIRALRGLKVLTLGGAIWKSCQTGLRSLINWSPAICGSMLW